MTASTKLWILLAALIAAGTGSQEEFGGERVPVEWELPEPPELIYFLATQETVVIGVTVLPAGRVSEAVLLETFWARGKGNWLEHEKRYLDCIKEWKFQPGTVTTKISIAIRYIPFPYGSPSSQFGVTVSDTTSFEVRYETVAPASFHEPVRSRRIARMRSSCGA
jgi:hypothetical protein